MPAETVSLPAPVRTLPERIPLLHFLQTELAPFPGRAIATFRVVVACSVVLVLCMTLRVPESHLAVLMTAPDFIPIPELVVRGSLWLWPVFALGITAAVAANLLIAPTDPEALLCEELAARLRATEDAIARILVARREETGATRLAAAGIARLLLLLKSAEVAHPSLKSRHPQQSA